MTEQTLNDFGEIVRNREAVRNEIKSLEQTLKSHNEEIEVLMIAMGHEDTPIETAYGKVAIIKSHNKRIDQQKLLEFGVEPGVIVAATVTKEYQYIKVTVAK